MGKIEDAVSMLKDVQFDKNINNKNMAARFIVAATGMKPNSKWEEASNNGIRIHEALDFLNKNYDTNFSENTRESLRKNGPKKMQTVNLATNNSNLGIATNSNNFCWSLTPSFFEIVKSFGKPDYYKKVESFLKNNPSRIKELQDKREKDMIPINYNGLEFKLTLGKHNQLHKEILEEFAPRFAGGSELLYVGDTINKKLIFNEKKISSLGFQMNEHDLLPDIVLYNSSKDWIYLIEAVSSVGPMSLDRVDTIDKNYFGKSGLIFVTAFQNWSVYKKFVDKIAWETEIWIAEYPEHMIHMNGDRFMGPRNN